MPVRPQLRAPGELAGAVLGLPEAARSSLWPVCPRGSLCAGLRPGNVGQHRAVRPAVLHIATLHRTAAGFGSGPWETSPGGRGNKPLTHSPQPFARVIGGCRRSKL